MKKELAENLNKEWKEEYGDEFIKMEEMIDLCIKKGVITPTSAGNYNLVKKFQNMKQAQETLPENERLSDTAIRNEIASQEGCSPHKIYLTVKDSE